MFQDADGGPRLDVAHRLAGLEELRPPRHGASAGAHADRADAGVPYTVALAAYRDPTDPASFSADGIADPKIRGMAELIVLEPAAARDGKRAGSSCR